MKKFYFLLLLFVGVNVNAQIIESLIPQKIETDPMTGNTGGVAWVGEHIYFYETEKGKVCINEA